MRLLALDTSTPRGSVAILEEGDVRAEVRRVSDSHSGWLVPAVQELTRAPGWSPREIDGFAVAVGPGSFTGLRVGLSTVQGLALAAGRPCVGVVTLDALAFGARGAADTLVALVDAFRDEVFFARYDREGRLVGERGVGSLDRAFDGLSGTVAFVGDGALRYAVPIRARCPEALLPEAEPFLAASVGRLALARFQAGEGIPPRDLRPVYLREPAIRKPVS